MYLIKYLGVVQNKKNYFIKLDIIYEVLFIKL